MNNKLKQEALILLQNILDEACGNQFIFPEYQKMISRIKSTMKNISEKRLYNLMMSFLHFGFDYVMHSHTMSQWSERIDTWIRNNVECKKS